MGTNWPGALDTFPDVAGSPGNKTIYDLHDAVMADQSHQRNGGMGVFNVVNFGAVAGGGAGSAKAGVLAAINAATANTSGGVVLFPAGVWDVGDLAILLPDWNAPGNKSLILRGAGALASTLKFSTDRGLGTFAISCSGPSSSANAFNLIEDIGVVGPGNRNSAIGTAPCAMDGIRFDTQMKLHRTGLTGFRSGIVSMGNHCSMRDVEVSGCYYALYFAGLYGNGGDILLDNCKLSGNKYASIAVKDGSLATFCMIKGHLGFSPYGIYFETSISTALSLGGTQFIGTSFEYLGNGAFYSEGQTARVTGVQFFQCGNYSRNFAAYGLASRTVNPMIYVAEWTDILFTNGTPLNTVNDGAVFDVLNYMQMDIRGNWTTSLNTAASNSQPWILAGGTLPSIALAGNGIKAFAAKSDPNVNNAILVGSVLEYGDAVSINRVRLWGLFGATSKSPLAGIALNAVAASSDARTMVVVVQEHPNATVLFDGSSAGAYLATASATVAGKATGVVYDGTTTPTGGRPVIGGAFAAAALPTSAGSATVRVKI